LCKESPRTSNHFVHDVSFLPSLSLSGLQHWLTHAKPAQLFLVVCLATSFTCRHHQPLHRCCRLAHLQRNALLLPQQPHILLLLQ
jgi:hypothetical protein